MQLVDLLLHPVRWRIVQAFLGGRQLTTAQLKAELPDTSNATLYRHIAALLNAGVLEVTGETQTRGATERTYRLRYERASIPADELAEMSLDEHRAAFTAFLAAQSANFDRYLSTGDVDLQRDIVGYRQTGFYATDEELEEVVAAIRSLIAPLREAGPTRDRRRRLLTTILLPAD